MALLEMRGIGKSFGALRANDGVDLDVNAGEIVGLLGENGSGKSTLMKVLFGMMAPDAGGIVFRGRELSGHTPGQALEAGIGMVHQHFMLIDAMSVAENVMLGWSEAGRWLRTRAIGDAIRETSRRYGLDLDPDARVGDLSLGRRQRVEILKLLLRGAELLILDEPTSNLSPPEIEGLIGVMRRLKAEGKGIVFITHKLAEVLAVCDRVVVLRDGRVAGRREVAGATREGLAELMVGRDVTEQIRRTPGEPGDVRLSLRALTVGRALSGVSFDVRAGEVLGIAGVDGNGQLELVQAIAGLQRVDGGRLMLAGRDLTAAGVAARTAAGLSYIPADRAHTSIVPAMSISENLALRDVRRRPLSRGRFLSRRAASAHARRLIEQYAIRTPGPDAAAVQLSGGNQQKIVVAREMSRGPKVLVALQATWGLDPGATRFVLDQVLALRGAGAAVLYVSSDLDEVLAIADRIGVLHAGELVGIMRRHEVDVAAIGLMMAGAHRPSPASAAA